MVSWGTAFKKSFKLWAWCLVWVGVGALVIAIISGVSLLAFRDVLFNPPSTFGEFIETSVPLFIGIIAGFIVGSLIAVIGVFASIVKVVTDAVEEQTLKRSLAEVPVRRPTVPMPPSAAQYCPNCGRQIVDPSVVYCPDCGQRLRNR